MAKVKSIKVSPKVTIIGVKPELRYVRTSELNVDIDNYQRGLMIAAAKSI